jgi:hypothetical protein
LKSKAIYDNVTEVSYIVESLPTDLDVLAVASRNHIFFADPGFVVINSNDKNIVSKIESEGGEKVAVDVYKYPVT